MYLKVQLTWNVVIPLHQLDSKGLLLQRDSKGLLLQRAIIIRLMVDLSSKRATEDHGYFIALTTLENIYEGKVRQDSGDVLFPVTFNCITFKPFKGEILPGKVNRVLKQGVFLDSGPIENLYLPASKMADYRHIPGENPIFVNDKLSRIEKDVEIHFMVLGCKWIETDRVFLTLVSLEGESGDYLGPVS